MAESMTNWREFFEQHLQFDVDGYADVSSWSEDIVHQVRDVAKQWAVDTNRTFGLPKSINVPSTDLIKCVPTCGGPLEDGGVCTTSAYIGARCVKEFQGKKGLGLWIASEDEGEDSCEALTRSAYDGRVWHCNSHRGPSGASPATEVAEIIGFQKVITPRLTGGRKKIDALTWHVRPVFNGVEWPIRVKTEASEGPFEATCFATAYWLADTISNRATKAKARRHVEMENANGCSDPTDDKEEVEPIEVASSSSYSRRWTAINMPSY